MATSDAPQSEDRKISEMPQDERNEAMGVRTLPDGKTIGHGPVGGYDWRPEDLPDFIGVKYGGGKVGYVRKTDFFAEYFRPKTEDVDELRERERERLREGPRTIPSSQTTEKPWSERSRWAAAELWGYSQTAPRSPTTTAGH